MRSASSAAEARAPSPPRHRPRSRLSRARRRLHASCFSIALLGALWGCTCNDVAGPGAQMVQSTRELQETRELPSVGAQVTRLSVSRITAEPELHPPRVVFSFDLDAEVPLTHLRSGGKLPRVAVGALGVERVPMVYAAGHWQPAGATLPRLEEALGLLVSRAEAAARAGKPLAQRWTVRVDLDRVAVTEELLGGGRKALALAPDANGALVLAE